MPRFSMLRCAAGGPVWRSGVFTCFIRQPDRRRRPVASHFDRQSGRRAAGQPIAISPGTHQPVTARMSSTVCWPAAIRPDHGSSMLRHRGPGSYCRGVRQPAGQYPPAWLRWLARDQHPGTWSRRAVAQAGPQLRMATAQKSIMYFGSFCLTRRCSIIRNDPQVLRLQE